MNVDRPSKAVHRAPGLRIALNVAALGSLAVLAIPGLTDHLPIGPARVILALRSESYSETEASQLVQGYYEQLNEGSVQGGLFAGRRPGDEGIAQRRRHFSDFTRSTRDIRQLELIPDLRRDYRGTTITINRWGMRDRDVDKPKPPGTTRIALLGSSVVMGFGVGDEETFGRLLEQQLNTTQTPDESPAQYQVLNFASGKYYAIHRRAQLEITALEFDPDVVLYFAHQDELLGPIFHLTDLAFHDQVDDPCLQGILRDAGIDGQTPYGVIRNRLRDHARPIVACTYERIVRVCRQRGITPIWVYLPMPGEHRFSIPPEIARDLAADAGFEIIDLTGWDAGYEPQDVKLSETDNHANPLGHRLIARKLQQALAGKGIGNSE